MHALLKNNAKERHVSLHKVYVVTGSVFTTRITSFIVAFKYPAGDTTTQKDRLWNRPAAQTNSQRPQASRRLTVAAGGAMAWGSSFGALCILCDS